MIAAIGISLDALMDDFLIHEWFSCSWASRVFLVTDMKIAWHFITRPKQTFEEEKSVSGYWPVLRWFLLLNVILALFTPLVSWLGFPANIIHSGTNAQMGAYVYAPVFEATTGSRDTSG